MGLFGTDYDPFMGYASLNASEEWLKQQLKEGSGATGSWDKELIPTEEATTIVPPEGGFRGTADPGLFSYLTGIVGGVLSPSAYMGGIPSLGEDIGRRAFNAAQFGRKAGEAVAAVPEQVSSEVVGWSGLPPAPTAEDQIAKYKAQTSAPVPVAGNQPIMNMTPPPVNLQESSGYVHLTDPSGKVIKDYTGTGSSYKPSAMEPGSSAYEMFERPRQAQIMKDEAAKIAVEQDRFLLDEAKKYGPQVLRGAPSQPESIRELEGISAVISAKMKTKLPEASKKAKAGYEKASPGKLFENLPPQDQEEIVKATALQMVMQELGPSLGVISSIGQAKQGFGLGFGGPIPGGG